MNTRTRLQMFVILIVLLAGSVTWALAQRGTTTSKTFKVKKGSLLVIEVDNTAADIRVKVWNKNEINIKVEGIPEQYVDDLEMNQSGDEVTVEYYPGYGRHGHYGHVRFVANVPSETDLDLATSGGDIEVDGDLKGDIDAGTSGGDIEVGNVDGEVDLATSGGDIYARNVKGTTSLKTSGGDIEVGDVDGDLEAATAGGDISIGTVTKDLRAATAGGDIEVGDIGGDASVSTAGGDVIVGKVSKAAKLKTAGGDIECKSATGFVVAQTAGGDIELQKVTGYCEAETAGGDIVVGLIPDEDRSSSMETQGGDIELSIPENAKVTIEARIRIRYDREWDREEYDVYSDFKAKSKDKDRRGIKAVYELNGGGRTISLETVQGNIEIRKMR